ncbi:hypothetical protein BCR34DRAFT_388076 [Clohesyomyces aquaticus]|uniref:Uncharacterized protein n=1 Tax=Clohesyomyces aquaticus TaxID=1231657 RepID=A0A1Y1ZF49_9PLEO|nr:hypothetical protein BCR34DRAFT_388076 [Clohesyomyces aquaticus]
MCGILHVLAVFQNHGVGDILKDGDRIPWATWPSQEWNSHGFATTTHKTLTTGSGRTRKRRRSVATGLSTVRFGVLAGPASNEPVNCSMPCLAHLKRVRCRATCPSAIWGRWRRISGQVVHMEKASGTIQIVRTEGSIGEVRSIAGKIGDWKQLAEDEHVSGADGVVGDDREVEQRRDPHDPPQFRGRRLAPHPPATRRLKHGKEMPRTERRISGQPEEVFLSAEE